METDTEIGDRNYEDTLNLFVAEIKQLYNMVPGRWTITSITTGFWNKVQQEFSIKYGEDFLRQFSHHARTRIFNELNSA